MRQHHTPAICGKLDRRRIKEYAARGVPGRLRRAVKHAGRLRICCTKRVAVIGAVKRQNPKSRRVREEALHSNLQGELAALWLQRRAQRTFLAQYERSAIFKPISTAVDPSSE